jgi:hypothetical protein
MSSMLRLKQKVQSAFLQQYQLERKFLILADKRRGSAALKAGIDSDDIPVLVKIWPRLPSNDDSDLREIWRNEIRQLHRLAGHPGAADYIVELRTSHEDELGFYLTLNPGQRRPLDKFFGDPDASGRRAIPKALRDRRLLWSNLRRIALGLEILHSQGLLHRNLTTWSVLTTGGDEVDFQLTGFEWSMRLVSSEGRSGLRTASQFTNGHSFIRDWQDFGQLAVILLGIGQKIRNRSVANHEVHETVSADEIKFVRQLLQIAPTELVDGSFVVMRIDEILMVLDAQAKNKEPRFNIVITLGQQSPLGRKVREASGDEIEIDDVAAQRQFVEADLFSPILISERVPNQPDRFNLVLRGQHLSYQLVDYTFGPEKTPSNWDAAACFRADVDMPLFHNIIKSMPLPYQAINLLTPQDMRGNVYRTRERFTSWEELRRRLKPATESVSRDKVLQKSFALTQMLEYLFAAADLFPVQIVRHPSSQNANHSAANILIVRPRADENRDQLCRSLGLRDVLAVRLGQALQEDRTEHDGSRTQNWRLTDSSILGGRSATSTEWKFQSAETTPNGELQFLFVGDHPPPDIEDAFLISDDSVGTHEQFLRRMRSFKALANHGELSRMLVDPRSRILHNDETVTGFPQFFELDDSKQKAFKATVETIPLFLVQGPPGVGKTRLVRELVRYSLAEDRSSRLLLSAQSNHAVDHLLHEIEEIHTASGDVTPLIVRCRAPERKDETNPFDIGQQSKRLIKDLIESDLYGEASAQIKGQIDGLRESYGLDWTEDKWVSLAQRSRSSRRALEGLVLRAANLVFATTNSGELGRLIEEKGQFDWSIIEEAGKATGGELISPLLLSHRRLMIGDHKQLPPFGAEWILSLLEKPKAVKEALKRGDSMIGRIFRDSTIDEIFSDVDAAESSIGEQTFANLCAEATRMFSLFETIIEDEFERQTLSKPGRPIAMPLTAQHRMHPAIAKIVSNSFYNERLITDSGRELMFRTNSSPIVSLDPTRLPDSPIVWIDMPWVQNTMNMKLGETLPRYTNDLEIAAVEAILQLLSVPQSEEKKPSLAILSPYSRQVSRLNHLADGKKAFEALEKFSRAAKQKTFCSTVDSFQGSEADCIVISLVRNNHLGSVAASLGFLGDARRMNVLLSRARWKVIVIGSLDFLNSINNSPKSAGDAIKIDFLDKLLSEVNPDAQNDDFRIVPFSHLLGGSK